jgi:TolB-like protein/DNA-binding winged helix-turn-helix (wHTH) protein/Flp pilus assembly protein TadD
MQGDFRLDDWLVQPALCRLSKDGHTVQVRAKVMDLLAYLAGHPGEVIPKGRLLDDVWGSQAISESALTRTVTELRQALGDDADQPRLLETIPKRGYRLIGPVTPVSEAANAPAPEPAHRVRGRLRAVLAAGAVAAALLIVVATWAWRGAGANGSLVTVAVLPFDTLGNDPEQYLADGLTEDTTTSLGMIDPEHLNVKGRTSAMRYKRTTKSLAEIGRELTVDYLVESSVRVEGQQLRVTSKLIRVRDQAQVWSESYERQLTSMLGLQREISIAIAEQIGRRLSPQRLSALTRRDSQSSDAYVLYLMGKGVSSRATPAANKLGVQYYQRALKLDPHYALAWSGIAWTYNGSAMNADADPMVARPLAEAAATSALKADPDLAEAQGASGAIAFVLQWDWPRAERALRRAIELDRNYAAAHRQLGHLLSQMRRPAEAAAAMKQALDLEPLDPMYRALASQVAFQSGDYASAVDYAQQALHIDREFWVGSLQLGQAYDGAGQNDLALQAVMKAEQLSGGSNSKVLSLKGYVLAKAGKANEAREVLKKLEALSDDGYVPPYATALVYAGLGDRASVFQWLDLAVAKRDVHLIFLPADSKWDPYRADPRFQKILERCGFSGPGEKTR